MISRLNHVNVFVLDQERAKTFYTETLGFELRNDATLDGFRWLTVGPAGQPEVAHECARVAKQAPVGHCDEPHAAVANPDQARAVAVGAVNAAAHGRAAGVGATQRPR